jgi:Flp pilus assembly protein TadG
MKIYRSESGQATVFVAIFAAIVMVGFLAFALDVGYFFHEQRMAQAAADSAALVAAEEDGYGNSSNVQTAANAVAKLNGFDTTLSSNPATVTITKLTSGTYSKSGTTPVPTTWMQATVSRPIPAFFLSGFKKTPTTMTVSAVAVAGEGESSPTCVCLEATGTQNLNMSNGSKLSAPSCGVVANSSSSSALAIYGGSTLSALSLGTVSSTWDTSSNVYGGGSVSASTKVVQGTTSTCSPAMPAAPVDTNCSADPLNSNGIGGSSYTVGPGSSYGTTQGGNTICYTSLSVAANSDTVTLNPGIYVINGGSLHFANGTQKGGAGVFFYLENGASLTIDNGANVSLSAPTSGTYSGVLFYQQASDTNAVSIAGGSSASISGAIYAPGAVVNMSNGSSSSVTSNVVAQTLNMSGGGSLNVTASTNMGTLDITGARLSQ